MEQIGVSQFKATCCAVLERVRLTRKAVFVTRLGRPIAQIVPVTPPPLKTGWLGAMRGTGEIVGDIVAPASHGAC